MNSEKNLKAKKKKLFDNFCYDFVKVTGAIPMLLWMRPKIYYPFGKPAIKGAVLISANHRTFLDPVVVHLAFPFRRLNCLATKDLYRNKVLTFFFNQMHCIVVDKENFSLASFRTVVDRLKDDKAVVIFPEGQVNQDQQDTILTFKSGAVLMAQRAKAPILPMYIVKRKKWYQRQRILVGQPVNLGEILSPMPSMQEISQASELLRDKEVQLRQYYESLPVYQKHNPQTALSESEERSVNV